MDLEWAFDIFGETGAAAAAGVLVGAIFGVSAQRSRFCLRAAAVEFARGGVGERMGVWLLCFSTALVWTQAFRLLGMADLDNARVLAGPGSISGAVLGGLMVGAGMILARGCSGRLLVLAASGNLRSLVTGLVFVVAAQMAWKGVLAPVRDAIAGAWITGPRNIELTAALDLPPAAGLALGLGFALLALATAWRARVRAGMLVFGSGVGFAVGAGWWITTQLSRRAFEPTPVESLTFSGPSADALMALLARGAPVDFGVGLVAGVFGGAFAAALLAGESKFEGFDGAPAMRRHLVGAVLMGFGAMLAGGCAIGAGVSGASALSATHWLALLCIWIGAAATDLAVDRPRAGAALAA